MAIPLPDHDHCKFCGDAVPFDRAYCKEECYWNDQARMKKEKNDNVRFAVLTVVSVVIIAVVGILM
jgi:Uncharacterized protein containing a Zn-ribbon